MTMSWSSHCTGEMEIRSRDKRNIVQHIGLSLPRNKVVVSNDMKKQVSILGHMSLHKLHINTMYFKKTVIE